MFTLVILDKENNKQQEYSINFSINNDTLNQQTFIDLLPAAIKTDHKQELAAGRFLIIENDQIIKLSPTTAPSTVDEILPTTTTVERELAQQRIQLLFDSQKAKKQMEYHLEQALAYNEQLTALNTHCQKIDTKICTPEFLNSFDTFLNECVNYHESIQNATTN